ncbi:reticulon-like protein B22 isoform X2 [Hibiscus syriacus]|uniref:reticulon-like protein B22 isoform X2 n=1 Tax=Hibiscus syriacus TaxID=106335 RepID=UPI001924B579|nr:reticulon-like protein B22 isoform X2 [Hibiscus syriacus]
MEGEGRSDVGKALGLLICGTLVYYHCAYRNSTILSLFSDVSIILLCSLAILGLLFHQMISSPMIPVDPLEWQISQDAANSIFAWLANTVGAAESVLRVAATAHDKRLFFGVVVCLYILSAIGRLVSGATVAYAGLCLFCLYTLAESLQSIRTCVPQFQRPRNGTTVEVDNM